MAIEIAGIARNRRNPTPSKPEKSGDCTRVTEAVFDCAFERMENYSAMPDAEHKRTEGIASATFKWIAGIVASVIAGVAIVVLRPGGWFHTTKPDLTITEFRVEPTRFNQEQPPQATVIVFNNGDAPAHDCRLSVKWFASGTIFGKKAHSGRAPSGFTWQSFGIPPKKAQTVILPTDIHDSGHISFSAIVNCSDAHSDSLPFAAFFDCIDCPK